MRFRRAKFINIFINCKGAFVEKRYLKSVNQDVGRLRQGILLFFRRRLLDEETESIRRELDSLKTRIRKYTETLMMETIIIVHLMSVRVNISKYIKRDAKIF